MTSTDDRLDGEQVDHQPDALTDAFIGLNKALQRIGGGIIASLVGLILAIVLRGGA